MKMFPLSRYFPLRVYEEEEDAAAVNDVKAQTEEPQLWMDAAQPDSVFWHVSFQLHGIKHAVYPTNTHESSPGGHLPALLLKSSGDLLASGDIQDWFAKQLAQSNTTTGDEQAWCALFERTLKPAYLAAIYSEPLYSQRTSQQYASRPCLSRKLLSLLETSEQAAHLAHLRDLLSISQNDVVITEDLDARARQSLEAASQHLSQQQQGQRWFLGTEAPGKVDALLATYIQLFLSLANQEEGEEGSSALGKPLLYNVLHRPQLRRLLEWYRQLQL